MGRRAHRRLSADQLTHASSLCWHDPLCVDRWSLRRRTRCAAYQIIPADVPARTVEFRAQRAEGNSDASARPAGFAFAARCVRLFSRAKSWLLPLDSGPHEFTVAEAHGPKADVKTCGITAPDVDAADFRAELIKSMKLGKPAAQTTSSDGQYRNTVWAIGDRSLMLSDGSPINLKQGIQLLVSDKPPAR
jgi:hypothetical protein